MYKIVIVRLTILAPFLHHMNFCNLSFFYVWCEPPPGMTWCFLLATLILSLFLFLKSFCAGLAIAAKQWSNDPFS